MKDRIQQLMHSQHLNQQAFANKTGIAPATLSNIFSERTRPTLQHVEALMKTFPTLNLGWLLSGQGEMFAEPSTVLFPGSTEQKDPATPVTNGRSTTDNMAECKNPKTTEQDMFAISQNSISQLQLQQPRQTSRKITEIRVFFDDQTWESFVPKK